VDTVPDTLLLKKHDRVKHFVLRDYFLICTRSVLDADL
jgi:hypothetical protein